MSQKRKMTLVKPVLKWVGGKRQLLPEIEKYIPKEIETYYEPFLGGGAVLFHLQPQQAIVSDLNEELINVYQVIKENVDELIKELNNKKKYENTQETYYRIRELDRNSRKMKRLTKVERAARILYLNRTCYNGLYRVNSSGEFNTPFGSYRNPNIVNETTLRAVHQYLRQSNIQFFCQDFEQTIQQAKQGDFVYLDPPYAPISKTSNFTGYNGGGFGLEEQERLKYLCDELDKKKVKFLVSNSDCETIRQLYKDYNIVVIKAKRSVNVDPSKRGEVKEVLIKNY